MGEDIGGSSPAARRAPEDEKDDPGPEDQPPGLIRRLIAAFRPDTAPSPDTPRSAQSARPGLGNLLTKSVADVAVPRAEIVSVPVDMNRSELVDVFRDSGLTRLPVFEETLDSPLGLVHLKDLALKHGFNGKRGRFSLHDLLRPVLFVPPSMTIGVLLQKMQAERKHMALVIDEYGGVDGLATIEDLIEQVLGEIEDEHDMEEADYWKQEQPGRYIVQSRAPLEAFELETGLRLADEVTEDEIDTLGGLVFMLAGRVPARGEVVRHPSGTEFHIMDADPRRIKRLRVMLPGAAGAEPRGAGSKPANNQAAPSQAAE